MVLKIPAEEEFAACMESLAPKRSADRDEEEEDAPEAAGFLPSIAVLSQPNKKNYLTADMDMDRHFGFSPPTVLCTRNQNKRIRSLQKLQKCT